MKWKELCECNLARIQYSLQVSQANPDTVLRFDGPAEPAGIVGFATRVGSEALYVFARVATP
jgi:hypothetical protein